MTDTTESTTALATLLESRLMEWEKARKPQELKLLECYQDVLRIPRDDDTTGTGAARAKKAKGLFIGSTRNKVRSTRAKINDALFGAGKLPFDTTPTNEKLAPYADAIEAILTEQFGRMKFKKLLKGGVNTLAKYGTGFIFGPFVRKECLTEVTVGDAGGASQLQESKFEFDCPYFELANTLDVYPDCEATEVAKALGLFWVTMESPHTIEAWKADKSYKNVDLALKNPGDNSNETGGEIARQRRANIEFWHKNERIKVARFFGKVPKSALAGEQETPADSDSMEEGEMVDVVAIMAGGVVVKVDPSPYNQLPALRCAYEDEENEMWGIGVAENNAPHQKVTNAAFRLFMEGKGMALLGTTSVDRSKFLPTEDFKKFPGKVYQMKPGLSPDERKEAILHHVEPDVTGGWMDVIRISEGFSDDDTAINKYTQGDDSRNLNKTAAGISMIMSAGSLPTKEVIQNIDEDWIEEIVERTIDWNLKYLEVETVQKIHGDEIAEIWRQIKEFGKTSFMDWQATGTSSFMQKEVLTNKIRAFADFAMGNPVTAPLIDARELLQQTWDVMEIGKESPILEADKGLPPEVQQQMTQMQDQIKQMGEALNNAAQQVDKLEASNDAALKKLEVAAYAEITKRLAVLAPTLTMPEADALAVSTVQQALQQPDPDDAEQGEVAPIPQERMNMQPQPEMPEEGAEPQAEPQEPAGQPEA